MIYKHWITYYKHAIKLNNITRSGFDYICTHALSGHFTKNNIAIIPQFSSTLSNTKKESLNKAWKIYNKILILKEI